MRRITQIILLAALALSLQVNVCEARYYDAYVTERGQLKEVLGENWLDIDSLIVHGPINDDDFNTMYNCTTRGFMTSINLADADVEGKKIPGYAFFDAERQYPQRLYLNLRNVILPDDIEEIGKYAFALVGLEKINFPSSLRTLGNGSFYFCHWLSSDVILPEGITEIPADCFSCCQLFNRLVLPSTIRNIAEFAFYNTRMTEANFPEGLEAIQIGAFYASGELKEASLPNTIKYIGDYAFAMNDSLHHINIPEGLKHIPMCFVMLDQLIEEIEIPSSVEFIHQSAFKFCDKLHKVIFNEGLKTIGQDAFHGCAFDSIVFPKSLEKIYGSSFTYIEELRSIRSLSLVPPEMVPNEFLPNDGIFGPVSFMPTDIPVYVPKGSADLYRNAKGWNYYSNFIEMEDDEAAIDTITEMPLGNKSFFDLDGRIDQKPVRGFRIVRDNASGKVIYMK